MNSYPHSPQQPGQYRAYSPSLNPQQQQQLPPQISLASPDPTHIRHANRDDPTAPDFNFGFQQQQALQQQRLYDNMSPTPPTPPAHTVPVASGPAQSQTPLPALNRPPIRTVGQQYHYDSRTNSEIYADSFSATTLQFDSRNGSAANLLTNTRSGSQTPQWRDSSRVGSQVNLLKFNGDLRDFRSPSPGVSLTFLYCYVY